VLFEIDAKLFEQHQDFNELSEVAAALDVSVFELILSGGEDHVFLATGNKVKGFLIGRVLAGNGVRLLHTEKPEPGWKHFQ